MSVSSTKAASSMILGGSNLSPISVEKNEMSLKEMAQAIVCLCTQESLGLGSYNYSIADTILQYDGRFAPLTGSVLLDPQEAVVDEVGPCTCAIGSCTCMFDGKVYRFQIHPSETSLIEARVQRIKISSLNFAGHMLFLVDDFFPKSELDLMQRSFRSYSFSGSNFADANKMESSKTKCLSPTESLDFFLRPLQALESCYKFLAYIACLSDTVVSTQPWINHSRPAFMQNKTTFFPSGAGFHVDLVSEEGVRCLMPKASETAAGGSASYYPARFTNGVGANPLMLTLLMYSTPKSFSAKEHGLGTVFVHPTNQARFTVPCQRGRMVIFEGDITHALEGAKFKQGTVKTHRISLNLLVCFRHKKVGDITSLKPRVMSVLERLQKNAATHRQQAAPATK
jgi:hypothetical protein